MQSLCGSALVFMASLRGRVARVPREVWGPMDVRRHADLYDRGIHLHVYRHGTDVSNCCRFFDDTPGHERAELFLENEHGRKYLNADHATVAFEVVTEFEVRRGDPFR